MNNILTLLSFLFISLFLGCSKPSLSSNENDDDDKDVGEETSYSLSISTENYEPGDTVFIDVNGMHDSLLTDSTFITIGDYQASFWNDSSQLESDNKWPIVIPLLFLGEGAGAIKKEISLYVNGHKVESIKDSINLKVNQIEGSYSVRQGVEALDKIILNVKKNLQIRNFYTKDAILWAHLVTLDSLFVNPENPAGFLQALEDIKAVDIKYYFTIVALLNKHKVIEKMMALELLSESLRLNKKSSLLKRGGASEFLFKATAADVPTTYLSVEELATSMQSYVLWDDYSGALHEAINDFFYDFIAVSGLISTSSKLTPLNLPLAIVQAALSWTDFFLNKVYLASFPAEMDPLKIRAGKKIYNSGDTTSTSFIMSAQNKAQAVGVQDIVSLILATLGVPASKAAFKNSIEETLLTYLTMAQGQIALWNDNYPDWKLDPKTISMPQWRWLADVYDYDSAYIELVSADTTMLTPSLSENEWVFADDLKKTEGVTVTLKQVIYKEELIFANPPIGITYNAGVFGESVASWAKDTFYLSGSDLKVDIDYPLSRLEAGDTARLTIHTSYTDDQGEVTEAIGIDIGLSVSGGSIEVDNGVTDSLGSFSVLAQMAVFSDQMRVDIIIKDTLGNELSRNVRSYPPVKYQSKLLPEPKFPSEEAMKASDCLTELDKKFAISLGEGKGYRCEDKCTDLNKCTFKGCPLNHVANYVNLYGGYTTCFPGS